MTANDKAFVFVTEFEIRLLGTNADVKYKSSLFILLLNIKRRAETEADSSTKLKCVICPPTIFFQSPYLSFLIIFSLRPYSCDLNQKNH